MRGGVYASGDGTPARQALLRFPKVAFEGGCEVAALITSDAVCHADHAEVTLGQGLNDSAVDASGGAKDGFHGEPGNAMAAPTRWVMRGRAQAEPFLHGPDDQRSLEASGRRARIAWGMRIRNAMAGESQAPRGRAVSRGV
jgi:hypothetical protein